MTLSVTSGNTAPQQVQIGSSSSSIPRAEAHSRADVSKSLARSWSVHPG